MTDGSDWYSEDNATLGDRLAAAREHAGLTQKAVAIRLGVKPSTIAAWEDDMKEPRANRLTILSGMMGISLAWLMTGRGEGPDGPAEDMTVPTDVAEILTEVRGLRVEILQASERLGHLEKKLRRTLETAQ